MGRLAEQPDALSFGPAIGVKTVLADKYQAMDTYPGIARAFSR